MARGRQHSGSARGFIQAARAARAAAMAEQGATRLGPMLDPDARERLERAINTDTAAHLALSALWATEGCEAFVVGGAVRDALRGTQPKDIDLLVRGLSADRLEQVLAALPGRVEVTGKAFGVLRYRHPKGAECEIALPRRERSTGAGHADFAVDSDPQLALTVDLGRRDLTCNAIAYHPPTGRIVDPHGGAADIAAGRLRCVSARAFPEDPLRILRALRARARYGLIPDDATFELMRRHADSLRHLSAERVAEEWEKLLACRDGAEGVRLAGRTGVLEMVLPAGFPDDAPVRMADALDEVAMADGPIEARHAAIYSQLHPHLGLCAALARQRMAELKYPKRTIDETARLLEIAGRYTPATDPYEARRILAKLGPGRIDAFAALRAAIAHPAQAAEEAAQLRGVVERGEPTRVADLAIDGSSLKAAGMAPGPQLGETLRQLLWAVIKDPSKNTPEQLLALARRRA